MQELRSLDVYDRPHVTVLCLYLHLERQGHKVDILSILNDQTTVPIYVNIT
jgi:hypothetical protein